MEHNSSREKIAWLAVIAVLMLGTFGLFRLAGATQDMLAGDDGAVEEVAMNRPAPAQNNMALPEDLQRQKAEMQNTNPPNPQGWASAPFDLKFTPGPAFKDIYEEMEKQGAKQQQQYQQPQQAPQQAPKKDKSQNQPEYRKVQPDETMEEFWKPDYYKDGLDL